MGTSTFDAVLESIELLSLEDQEALIELVKRRVIEHRRTQIAENIVRAKEEYQSGQVFRGNVTDVIAALNQ